MGFHDKVTVDDVTATTSRLVGVFGTADMKKKLRLDHFLKKNFNNVFQNNFSNEFIIEKKCY